MIYRNSRVPQPAIHGGEKPFSRRPATHVPALPQLSSQKQHHGGPQHRASRGLAVHLPTSCLLRLRCRAGRDRRQRSRSSELATRRLSTVERGACWRVVGVGVLQGGEAEPRWRRVVDGGEVGESLCLSRWAGRNKKPEAFLFVLGSAPSVVVCGVARSTETSCAFCFAIACVLGFYGDLVSTSSDNAAG